MLVLQKIESYGKDVIVVVQLPNISCSQRCTMVLNAFRHMSKMVLAFCTSLLIFLFALQPSEMRSVCSEILGVFPGIDGESCYFVHLERKSWESAERVCTSEGGHLTSIWSAYENSYLLNTAGVALIGENFWTGGAYQWRVTDTVLWYWNDDSNWSYDNWARGKEASRVYADFTCFFGSAPVLPENRTTKKET